MQEWGIPNEKIITVITDNGSNMVAAFKHITPEGEESRSEDSEDSPLTESDSDPETEGDLRCHHVDMDIEWTTCVVHTLQLVIHMIQKDSSVKRV